MPGERPTPTLQEIAASANNATLLRAFDVKGSLLKNQMLNSAGKRDKDPLAGIPFDITISEVQKRIPRLNEDEFLQAGTSLTRIIADLTDTERPIRSVFFRSLTDLSLAVGQREGLTGVARDEEMEKPAGITDFDIQRANEASLDEKLASAKTKAQMYARRLRGDVRDEETDLLRGLPEGTVLFNIQQKLPMLNQRDLDHTVTVANDMRIELNEANISIKPSYLRGITGLFREIGRTQGLRVARAQAGGRALPIQQQ